jgi:hypothetical protein
MAAVWSKASKGEPRSVDSAVRIIDRRIKLYGLDAPTKAQEDASAAVSVMGSLMAAITEHVADEDGEDPDTGDELTA